ncbi:MAG TPA: amidase [Acidimicrobiia bacterium]|nr:amidase [Acidimicrobiia bacterium]
MDFLADSVASIAGRVRRAEQSAREVAQHALERIEALNPSLNAFVAWDGERALAEAAAIDRRVAAGEAVGPLAGVPMGVKDLEAVEGFTTSYGSALHAGDPPAAADSVHVARLRRAGAVIVGKTNTPEYGHKGATDNVPFGQTSNPWSTSRSPGGSSGGTAVAIASGMVPLGTGSDGGGSIRIPAALCGLSGLKTETARIPIAGATLPGSGLLSTNGPMGRTVEDSAVALDAVVGPDGRDPLSLPHPGESWAARVATAEPPERVVWSPTLGYAAVDSEILASCRAAVDALAAAGTEVVQLDDVFPEDPVADWLVLWAVARFKAQGHLMGTADWNRLSETIRPQIEMGAAISGADHARAQDRCYALNWLLEDAFEHAPFVLTPTTAGRTPRLGEDGTIDGEADVGWVKFTYGINMTRNPAGSVCTGLDSDGLPVGMQVIGRHHDEAGVLGVMRVLEQVVGFAERPSEPAR